MGRSVLLLCVAVAMLVSCVAASESYIRMFEQFKAKYERKYANAAEEAKRFRVFVENMKKAEKLSKANPLATFGMNEYSDVSAAEFKIRHNGEKYFSRRVAERKNVLTYTDAQIAAAPQTIDWRAKGAVTGVKNQGQCGSCWSFSATGNIEGQWFLAGNKLTSVSEQELVSCDTIDSGCGGGLMDNAFDWLVEYQGGNIVTEAAYPYVSGSGVAPACSLNNKTMAHGATITGHTDIAHNESNMLAFVGVGGPLSIAVDATSFQTYTGGILTNCISDQIDHGVLIVGYDMTNSPPYWIIKNSWGASWGENGYIRVEYGSDQCLLTTYPSTSNASNSGPTPPPGPTPPGPAPPPTTGWTQFECTDFQCQNCEYTINPLGTCIQGSNGFSMIANCAADAVIINYYSNTDCSGSPTQTNADPIGVCSIVVSFFGEKFITNNCYNGPAPTSAAPNAPTPTPTVPPGPTPSQADFVQMQCQDAACSVGCQNLTFVQNVCLPLNGGGSAIVECLPGELQITEYSSTDCSGPGTASDMALNQCLQGTGIYFENFCPGQSAHYHAGAHRMSNKVMSTQKKKRVF